MGVGNVATFVAVVEIALGAAACSRGAVPDEDLFYVPIGYHTYVPVTPITIESEHFNQATFQESILEEVLKGAQISRERTFDPNITRVKVKGTNGHVILIDNEGGMRVDKREYRLSHHALIDLKRIIESKIVFQSYPIGQ